MSKTVQILVVDDDVELRAVIRGVLEAVGHTVEDCGTAEQALVRLQEGRFDVLLVDMMMTGVDGLGLVRSVRDRPEQASLKIMVLSAKTYESDRAAARRAGADGYLTKPLRPAELIASLARLLDERIVVRFFGVRGTLPAPGPENARYGGNTSCVLLELPGKGPVVLDAGSGIREAGRFLFKERPGRLTGHIFVTHPHWDHLNALPFFRPLYVNGNHWHICGPGQHGHTLRELVSAQMDGTFFPITPREFGALIDFHDLNQGTTTVGGLEVDAMLLMHPGRCLGYRFREAGRTVCYVTDNELFDIDDPRHSAEYEDDLAAWVAGADLLITDTTYFDEEYVSKVGWGHASVSQVARLAARAEVKELCLFHHDPEQSDDDIDRKGEACAALLAEFGSQVRLRVPAEGDHLRV